MSELLSKDELEEISICGEDRCDICIMQEREDTDCNNAAVARSHLKLYEQNEQLKAMLKRLEWRGESSSCPECGYSIGHHDDCELNALLQENKKTCETCKKCIYERNPEDYDQYCEDGINLNSIPEDDPNYQCPNYEQESTDATK